MNGTIPGVIRKLSTLSDGTLRIVIDLDANTQMDRISAMTLLGEVETPVAVARLQPVKRDPRTHDQE